MRIRGLQERISIGGIHEGMELGLQLHLVAARCHLKLGHVGSALYFNVVEHSLEFSFGGKHSGNSPEYTQVCILKQVIPGNRSLAGIVFSPRTELSSGADLPRWLGVGQGYLIRHWPRGADIAEGALIDRKSRRLLARLACGEIQN